MFISVVLPAPFSPTSAWTSPLLTLKLTSSFARTLVDSKYLVMPSISTAGSINDSPNRTTAKRVSTSIVQVVFQDLIDVSACRAVKQNGRPQAMLRIARPPLHQLLLSYS